MPPSSARRPAHLIRLTVRMLQLMRTLQTFTRSSAIRLLKRKHERPRLYNVLCALEGVGLLLKHDRQYKCMTQWYPMPEYDAASMPMYTRVIYQYVRTNKGLFNVRDMGTRFNIKLPKVYVIFCILKAIGVVTNAGKGCYKPAPLWDLNIYWKRALDNIWGDPPEMQVVQGHGTYSQCKSAQIIVGSKDKQSDFNESEVQPKDTKDLKVESNGTRNVSESDGSTVQHTDTMDMRVESNCMHNESDQSEVQCMDIHDWRTETFQLDDNLINFTESEADWTNTMNTESLWPDMKMYESLPHGFYSFGDDTASLTPQDVLADLNIPM